MSAQLSSQNIDELETVRLTIRASETRDAQALDLSPLEENFHVMGTNTSSQYRFVNGREQSWVDYQITLQPKTTGTIVIPGITVGADTTPTLKLNVNPLTTETRDLIDQLVFFENDISSDTIYVQAQLVVTRRLLYSNGVQLYSDLPGPPELSDAVVLALGETTASTTERNGRTYGVVEQRYAVFPETSGTLLIPGISLTASVRLSENGRVSRKGVRVGTDDAIITVLPVPAGYPADQPWLPATNVILHQEINPSSGIQVGDTITHELLMQVDGNVGSSAPPIDLALDESEFRTYGQAPVIDDDTSTRRVKGARLQTASVVPLTPGPLTIPARQVYWWDTRNDEMQISSTPALTFAVMGEAIQSVSAGDQNESAQNTAEDARTDTTWRDFIPSTNLMVALAVLLSIPALYGLWRISRHKLPTMRRTTPLRQALQQADDPASLHAALGPFLKSHYQTSAPGAVSRFAKSSSQVGELYEQLQAHLYRANASAFSSDQVERLKSLALGLPARDEHASSELPPLYPHLSTSPDANPSPS